MAHRADGLNDIFEHDVTVRENLKTDSGQISKTPTDNEDITNKEYVDDEIDAKLEDGTATGQLGFWDGTKWVHTETSELFWDDVNKRFGICIASPSQKLELDYGHFRMNQEDKASLPTATVNATAGNLNGDYRYKISFVLANGTETQAKDYSLEVSPANEQVDLSNIDTGTSKVVSRNIYRTIANAGFPYPSFLVTNIGDNTTTTYTDNLADAGLGVAENQLNDTGGLIYLNAAKIIEVNESATQVGNDAGAGQTGNTVVGFGVNATKDNTGDYVHGFGYDSCNGNTGAYVSACGSFSCKTNTGAGATGIGFGILLENDSTHCTADGLYAGYQNDGNYLCCLGAYSGFQQDGAYCCGIGNYSIRENTGDRVYAMGFYAGRENTGDDCIFLGDEAGYQNTTDDQLIIKQTSVNATSLITGDFSTRVIITGAVDNNSTTEGFMVNRVTTTQKNALTGANGMIVYDTTLNKFQGYENGSWTSLI